MKKLLNWIRNLFDTRTEYEKQEKARVIESIKKLQKTHHIYVGRRGNVSIIKKGKDEL
jgi:hypothetical protein